MATPSSPNAVCEPPFAFPQPARGAAKRPAWSVAAPPDRYRRTGTDEPAPPARPWLRGRAHSHRERRGLASGWCSELREAPGTGQQWRGGRGHRTGAFQHHPKDGSQLSQGYPGGCCRCSQCCTGPGDPRPTSSARAGVRDMPRASTAPFPTLPSRCVGTGRSAAKQRAGQDQKHRNHANKS